MDLAISNATLWWILVAALVAAEMVTGTFYLLMLAAGAAVAAIVAGLGAGQTAQLGCAALVSLTTVVALYFFQVRRRAARQQENAHTVTAHFNSLDVGEVVHVQSWQEDGTARVQYRGSGWQALAKEGYIPLQPGRHVVVDIRNNALVLQPAPLTASST